MMYRKIEDIFAYSFGQKLGQRNKFSICLCPACSGAITYREDKNKSQKISICKF
jgi:hypothetical protein